MTKLEIELDELKKKMELLENEIKKEQFKTIEKLLSTGINLYHQNYDRGDFDNTMKIETLNENIYSVPIETVLENNYLKMSEVMQLINDEKIVIKE